MAQLNFKCLMDDFRFTVIYLSIVNYLSSIYYDIASHRDNFFRQWLHSGIDTIWLLESAFRI